MIFSLIFFGAVVIDAQIAAPTPRPVVRSSSTAEQMNAARSSRETDARFRRMQDLEIRRTRTSIDGAVLSENIQSIYRKPTKEETRILSPAPHLLERYADFLRQSNTGITKLNADVRCGENSGVVAATENCLQYKMPGAGTAFSFRVESYRIPRLADLVLAKDVIKTDGVLQHGVMVNLGNVPLEDVTPETKGLKYLVDFKPVKTDTEFLKIDNELKNGIKSDGFIYRLGFYVSDEATFALRSIAYKANFFRSVNGVIYDEFAFDKRKDTMIVFRVVERDANGNITILWKMLSRRDAPTLKFEKTAK
jgi:hypothetical protein